METPRFRRTWRPAANWRPPGETTGRDNAECCHWGSSSEPGLKRSESSPSLSASLQAWERRPRRDVASSSGSSGRRPVAARRRSHRLVPLLGLGWSVGGEASLGVAFAPAVVAGRGSEKGQPSATAHRHPGSSPGRFLTSGGPDEHLAPHRKRCGQVREARSLSARAARPIASMPSASGKPRSPG